MNATVGGPAAQRRAVRRMSGASARGQDRRAQLSLHTELPLFECAHRLKGAIDEPNWAPFSLSGYGGSKGVIGTVNGTEIRLQQRSRIRHPWEAVFLDARLVPDDSGTRIEGRFRTRRSVSVQTETVFYGSDKTLVTSAINADVMAGGNDLVRDIASLYRLTAGITRRAVTRRYPDRRPYRHVHSGQPGA